MTTSDTAESNAGPVPIRAVDFLNGIGIDTHIAYTDGGYANLSNVQSDIAYLGITELRDGISNGENGSAPLSSYIQLAKAGEKFTFVVGGGTSTTASIQYTLATIEQLAAAVPGSVKAIEGPNEINNQTLTFNGVGGLQGAVALQRFLYQAVKATPSLSGVAVDYFTGYGTVGFAAGPDPNTTSGLADYDNQHPYPQGGQGPATWINPTQALPNEPGARGTFVYTETGYTTNLSDVNGVDATAQGKYTLDLLLDGAKDGSSGTYLYQLLDAYKPGSPQGDDGYGLFDTNNAPKLAATGIHDLAAILADTGSAASTFTPTALLYSVSGLPTTGNSLEIDKSDGTVDVVVWAEPQIWNESTKSEVAAPAETVTVNLGTAHAVSVYDPLVGTTPIATSSSTSSIQLAITDHPLVLQVGPAVASTVAATGAPSSTVTALPSSSSTTTTDTGFVANATPAMPPVASSPPTPAPIPTPTAAPVPPTPTSVAPIPAIGTPSLTVATGPSANAGGMTPTSVAGLPSFSSTTTTDSGLAVTATPAMPPVASPPPTPAPIPTPAAAPVLPTPTSVAPALSPPAMPADTTPPVVTFDRLIGFSGPTTVTLSGTVSDNVGVSSVEIFGSVNGATVSDIGPAMTDNDGIWSFTTDFGPGSFTSLSAVATDTSGNNAIATGPTQLLTGADQPYAYVQDEYTADSRFKGQAFLNQDGSVSYHSRYKHLRNGNVSYSYSDGSDGNHFQSQPYKSYTDVYDLATGNMIEEKVNYKDGTHAVSAEADGQTLRSIHDDTFSSTKPQKPSSSKRDHFANTHYVYTAGSGHDVVDHFTLTGAGHDSLTLPISASSGLASVIARIHSVPGGGVEIGLGGHDSITLNNVSASQLKKELAHEIRSGKHTDFNFA